MLYFHVIEEGEEKGKKEKKEREISMGEEGFPRAGPALLAVLLVAAVRCN
jgi:hypothetical protein